MQQLFVTRALCLACAAACTGTDSTAVLRDLEPDLAAVESELDSRPATELDLSNDNSSSLRGDSPASAGTLDPRELGRGAVIKSAGPAVTRANTVEMVTGEALSAEKLEGPGAPVDGDVARLMEIQNPLVDAATAIRELGSDEGSGYAGIELDVDSRLVKVWWKGEVPEPVREEVRRQADLGVRIELPGALHSQAELLSVAHQLLTDENGSGVHRAGPLPDGSGLELGVDTASTARALSNARLPVPVRVTVQPPFVEMSRNDDWAPYWGGAVLHPINAPLSVCTSGFAVWTQFLGVFWETSRGILAAEHCAGGNTLFFDGGGDYVGFAGPGGSLTDSVYIPVSSAGRIYDGGVPGTDMSSRAVDSVVGNFPGQLVCTSGAATGAHCGISVASVQNLVLLSPSGMLVFDVVIANQVSGLAAVGPGDSGGPVFTIRNSGKVRAAGHAVGANPFAPAACPLPGQTNCSSQVAYVDMQATLEDRGLRLVTQ